jgi:glycerol-3-phosphate O-acyltransferase
VSTRRGRGGLRAIKALRHHDDPTTAAVRRSPLFRKQLEELARNLGRPYDEVEAEATGHLGELSATHNEAVLGPWNRFGGWMMRGYDRLLDEEGLAHLRALDSKHSLAFLIAHRSYLDEWALPPALVEFGIEPPYGFAGANLDFFPLGSVARRTGFVHIRRATGDVPVYKVALRGFMRQLVSSHANLIWSIEGGRSRTGKLRPPRFGLLRYVVDAVTELESAEVQLVPVSILYDQLPTHEVDRMTSEALGQSKRPEDARWFFGYLRGLRHRLGRVYVDFGDPVPLRARLEELRAEGVTERQAVERIALEVSHRINVATPVAPTGAVCIALLAADRALTLDEILATVEPLAKYLDAKRWPTAGAANLTDRATVRRAVQDLVESGVLSSFRGETTVWGVSAQQHLTAAVYRNSAIHVLVHRAIVELVIVRAARDEAPFDAWQDSLELRELLKFEFFFPAREEYGRQLREELKVIHGREWVPSTELRKDDAVEYLKHMELMISHLILRPFLDAYAIVADQLCERGDTDALFDEERFLDRCLVIGRQWALQRRIGSEESVSSEMFRTALRLARHRDLVDSTGPESQGRRQQFVREIDNYRARIAQVALIADQRRQDALVAIDQRRTEERTATHG